LALCATSQSWIVGGLKPLHSLQIFDKILPLITGLLTGMSSAFSSTLAKIR